VTDLRAMLAGKPILIAPGVCDALTAAIAADAGFEALLGRGARPAARTRCA
jgi:2-methylisocitrate lyase-like PEP mutase family enzyme